MSKPYISKELTEAIKQIPPEKEWWTQSGQETFERLAFLLLQRGFSEEAVLDILTAAYFAVSAQYGE